MCLEGLKVTLDINDGELRLTLGKETTAEHIEEIMSLYDGGVRIIHNLSHGLAIEPPPDVALQTMAFDIGDEGARIKIAPDISFRGFLQDPPYTRRHALTDWEFGQLLARCPELAT